ncbi:hypothetical protein NP233_g1620 [Leucocoprinus birnbaumii]|uniref:HbrB-domain-containing protein n=1 Tax=Leucocoprinus birnbaumii TaxID=56174 RepID=A0AAD5W3Q1_9AGAR|nr:hypothetical protein NP233_g1620 [Leucocoprinus birnbaumii]
MHRLAPQLSSSSTLSLVPPGSISQASIASNSSQDPWGALHVHVLPLFNGEPLRIPIEDLNTLVKRHIQTVVTSTPNRALNMLEGDAAELIAAGMVTLNAKLRGVHDAKLIARVVETWNFFWDQVLTYVEGVLLPLQTHPLLSSLYRTPKSHRAKSPNRQNSSNSSSKSEHTSSQIDVRTIALRSFRDSVIVPLTNRLLEQFRLDSMSETIHQPRLQQMLLVLASQSENRSTTFSLAPPDPNASPSAAAIDDLLRALRGTRQPERTGLFKNNAAFPVRAPSFLSGGLPRDRRGRVAHKHRSKPSTLSLSLNNDDNVSGDETPRIGQSYDAEHRRRVELLDSLKSPDVESSAGPRASGGWGLGAGKVDKTVDYEEEEELDQGQVQVELNATATAPETDKPNPKNVAGGLKATINNPHTSDSAKESAEERLTDMQGELGSADAADTGKNTGNVIGGYKATISNPKTSEGAKEHAREKLQNYQKEGDLNDPDFIPED